MPWKLVCEVGTAALQSGLLGPVQVKAVHEQEHFWREQHWPCAPEKLEEWKLAASEAVAKN